MQFLIMVDRYQIQLKDHTIRLFQTFLSSGSHNVSKAMGVITKSSPVESCRVHFDSLRSWKADPYVSRWNLILVTFRQPSRVHWIWVKLLAWLCSVLITLESVSMAAGLCHLKMPDAPRASEECDVIVFYLSTRSCRVLWQVKIMFTW